MFGAGQEVITPDGVVGRILAPAGEHVPRRIYLDDICVPASIVLFESGEMRWFADSVLRPLTGERPDAAKARVRDDTVRVHVDDGAERAEGSGPVCAGR